MHIPFDNTYARLPERFYARLEPTRVAAPKLVRANAGLAEMLRIDPDELAAGAAVFAGNEVPAGAEPMALAYAGHQFGHFVPQLGDGRAMLLGEVVGRDGVRRDIQLKGSGPTRFSRNGDGRAALGPVLREYLISEAMAALGVPTTRTLAAVTTGEAVWRETRLPGAVLTRVAASHIRVGTFQYFAARGDEDGVRALSDYATARHYPAVAAGDYRGFLDGVVARQADLVAQWLLFGFIHGVMNTDNCSIAGETIDYGPCAFMDAYDPGAVFSSIDQQGRYAYGNQPRIALWNLTRLAECLFSLLGSNETAATDALAAFGPRFEAACLGGMRRKIGLSGMREGDDDLVQSLLKMMAADGVDFTLAFRGLCDAAEGRDAAVRALFSDAVAFDAWAERWRARLAGEVAGDAMRAVNPVFIPRNHLVEAALAAAVERGNFEPFEELLAVVSRPFDDDLALARFALPPREEERVLQTFCGT
jgi:serine/tyrosine/threonine adenylyltransferase